METLQLYVVQRKDLMSAPPLVEGPATGSCPEEGHVTDTDRDEGTSDGFEHEVGVDAESCLDVCLCTDAEA